MTITGHMMFACLHSDSSIMPQASGASMTISSPVLVLLSFFFFLPSLVTSVIASTNAPLILHHDWLRT